MILVASKEIERWHSIAWMRNGNPVRLSSFGLHRDARGWVVLLQKGLEIGRCSGKAMHAGRENLSHVECKIQAFDLCC
jgi:hypothetical protein